MASPWPAHHDEQQQAVLAEQQLAQWAHLGEVSLRELLLKDEQTEWLYLCSRDGIQGFSSNPPQPLEPGGARVPHAERLDYCTTAGVKAETMIEMEPAELATAYMNVAERPGWHSACQDARVIEELWTNVLRVCSFTYCTGFPILPARSCCTLVYRASRLLPDGRTQIVITDQSVAHPAMPPSHFSFMTIFPSGLIITPVQVGKETYSHVSPAHRLISHCHLGGALAPKVLSHIKGRQMVEACCFNYLQELHAHLLAPHAKRSHNATGKRPQAPAHDSHAKRTSNATGKRPRVPPTDTGPIETHEGRWQAH